MRGGCMRRVEYCTCQDSEIITITPWSKAESLSDGAVSFSAYIATANEQMSRTDKTCSVQIGEETIITDKPEMHSKL